ncbi:2Fe-2S iron-sulfur cluster-binding protein [Sphingomonas sp. LaA6.9]|uniref:2Fe-2S iron-sulfur cluster-binding protein n=1 Tax=Sphingomonas sp. LaA6.9 TaxID=2919914 RepID=UPI001F4F4F4A|nr:2Fe-2S iron-sulfur cluster-binding protein [Sphingomonas sp. LaA6.9]MCJ8159021.1 2Fe-2S iron-sulfur cluster-binding protein [Sphingomonas sp. LaA6.9]
MPLIKYVAADGTEHVVEAPVGVSVMKAAVDNGIPGIEGICGGQCACATCHCFIEDAWSERLPPMDELEDEMLAETLVPRRAGSRLGCQVAVNSQLEGLIVHLPESQ